MTQKFPWATMMAAVLVATLAGCTGTLSQVKDGQTGEPVWPDADAAHPVEESWYQPAQDNLRKVTAGLRKREVYALIGAPMFREGLVGVHEWDYSFVFHDAAGQAMQCQYKVLFDDGMRSAQTLWQTTACADAAEGRQVARVAAVQSEPRWVDLSADALFDFDSAVLAPQASAIIEGRIVPALEAADKVREIRIVGYTDQFGGSDYNVQLSLKRAEAVKAYLVGRGVPAAAIVTEGHGSADPVVNCPTGSRAARIACMQPNRRVRVGLTVAEPPRP